MNEHYKWMWVKSDGETKLSRMNHTSETEKEA